MGAIARQKRCAKVTGTKGSAPSLDTIRRLAAFRSYQVIGDRRRLAGWSVHRVWVSDSGWQDLVSTLEMSPAALGSLFLMERSSSSWQEGMEERR